jgi:NAD(P)-dependent dehydrogenase (short-subunit alcohol dehydrogenase family)
LSTYTNKLFNLESKVVVVTGGLGYLGSEIVSSLLKFGSKVAVFDNQVFTSKDKEKYQNSNNLMFVSLDLLNQIEIGNAYAAVETKFGKITSIVNCAAYGNYPGSGSLESISYENWKYGIEGTLGLTLNSLKEAIPFLKKSPQSSIVNFGSLYSWIAPDLRIYDDDNGSPPNYGAGKAAIVQLTRHAASELAKYGIRVNSVTPGSFPHPKTQENKNFIKRLSNRNMLGRIGFPDDIVGPVLFLLSDASNFITATNINVDGGQLNW